MHANKKRKLMDSGAASANTASFSELVNKGPKFAFHQLKSNETNLREFLEYLVLNLKVQDWVGWLTWFSFG